MDEGAEVTCSLREEPENRSEKNCGPREPNGQNFIVFRCGGKRGVTGLEENAVFIGGNAVFKALFFTPAKADCGEQTGSWCGHVA